VQESPEFLSLLSHSTDPGEKYSSYPKGYKPGQTKYIVVTGSVMSGLGKGIFSAALAHLLEDSGLTTNLIKMDGYFNEDAGTLSPFRHGEVFVLADGTECDMDVGTYERFVGKDFSEKNIFTNGRLARRVNQLERSGGFKGSDVQYYPHVTGEICRFVRESAMAYQADIALVEIGGTVGDEENRPYIAAMSDLAYREGERNVFFINLAWIIEAKHLNEQKTKAAQQGTNLLLQLGVRPHMLVCRAENPVAPATRRKLADRLRLPERCVIDLHDLETIYHVPGHIRDQDVHRIVLEYFGLADRIRFERESWAEYIDNFLHPTHQLTIGLVGKYVGPRDTYASIHNAIEHAGTQLRTHVHVQDVSADEIEAGSPSEAEMLERAGEKIRGLAGIIVPGGFGRRGAEGKIACIRHARLHDVPYLGLCYGFQLAAIEFARYACGIPAADTTENVPSTPDPVICLLPEQYKIEGLGGNMRLGQRDIVVKEGTLAHRLYGGVRAYERFRHRYELNPRYRERLEEAGLVFSGWAPNQPIMQILEYGKNRFHLGVQFHPEFTSRPLRPNALFAGFLEAAIEGATGRSVPRYVYGSMA